MRSFFLRVSADVPSLVLQCMWIGHLQWQGATCVCDSRGKGPSMKRLNVPTVLPLGPGGNSRGEGLDRFVCWGTCREVDGAEVVLMPFIC